MKGEWQPIETAPKDGTWVLCWNKWDGIIVLRHTSRSRAGRYSWRGDTGFWYVPTHWMPLPEPPEEKP